MPHVLHGLPEAARSQAIDELTRLVALMPRQAHVLELDARRLRAHPELGAGLQAQLVLSGLPLLTVSMKANLGFAANSLVLVGLTIIAAYLRHPDPSDPGTTSVAALVLAFQALVPHWTT